MLPLDGLASARQTLIINTIVCSAGRSIATVRQGDCRQLTYMPAGDGENTLLSVVGPGEALFSRSRDRRTRGLRGL